MPDASAHEAHVQEYTSRIEHLVQQMGSRFMRACEQYSFNSRNAQVVMQFGSVEMTATANYSSLGGTDVDYNVPTDPRHPDTVLTDTPMTSRWVLPADYGVADMVDREDLVRSLIDPKSGVAQAHAYAVARRQDDTIIAALGGTAQTGKDGLTPLSFAADGGTIIPAGGEGMTVGKLREAKRILMQNEVDVDREALWCAISAKEHDDLLNQTQAINFDYTNVPKLDNGRITSFMGFNFIDSERLLGTTSTERFCYAWAESGLAYGSFGGVEVNVNERPDKWNNWQIATRMTNGATRKEGKKFVQINCADPDFP